MATKKKTASKKKRTSKRKPQAETAADQPQQEYLPVSVIEGTGDDALLPRHIVEHQDFVKFAIAKRVALTLANSNLVPKEYLGRANDCFVAIQMGEAIGLNPFQAIQSIAVINGRPCVWGDALIGVCRASPKCEWIEESYDSESIIATCTTMRKGDRNPVSKTFSMEDAIKAGIWNKDIWKKYPERMLQMRARAFCLRDAYPDVLKGLHVAEEVMDYHGSPAPILNFDLPAAAAPQAVHEVPTMPAVISGNGSAPPQRPQEPEKEATEEDKNLIQKVLSAIGEATTMEALLKAADLAKGLKLPHHVQQARQDYQIKRDVIMNINPPRDDE